MLYGKFPTINYDGLLVRDISVNLDIIKAIKENVSIFDYYTIKDGETPESIAFDYYEDSEKNWLIIMMNDIVDPFNDWPLSITEMNKYIELVYGVGNESAHHHWEKNGIVVESDGPGVVSITNRQYEERKNESKRKIKLLHKSYADQAETEILKAIAQSNGY